MVATTLLGRRYYPIVQTRRLRRAEAKSPAQGHTVGKPRFKPGSAWLLKWALLTLGLGCGHSNWSGVHCTLFTLPPSFFSPLFLSWYLLLVFALALPFHPPLSPLFTFPPTSPPEAYLSKAQVKHVVSLLQKLTITLELNLNLNQVHSVASKVPAELSEPALHSSLPLLAHCCPQSFCTHPPQLHPSSRVLLFPKPTS